jgi:hypothetical protein
MERLEEMLSEPVPPPSPLKRLSESILTDHPDRLEHLEQRGDTLLAVVDAPDRHFAEELEQRISQCYQDTIPQLEMLDRATFDTLQRLAAAGVIQFAQPEKGKSLNTQDDRQARAQRRKEALIDKHLKAAEEKQRMSKLLAEGGFFKEALAPMNDALNKAMTALAVKAGDKSDNPISIGRVGQLQSVYKLPAETVSTVAMLRHESDGLNEADAKQAMASANEIIATLQEAQR